MSENKNKEVIVRDQLSEEDWNILLALDLKPVHMVYLKTFKYLGNRPITVWKFWSLISDRPEMDKMIWFEQVSTALKTRRVPYRFRAVSRDNDRKGLYKLVVVES